MSGIRVILESSMKWPRFCSLQTGPSRQPATPRISVRHTPIDGCIPAPGRSSPTSANSHADSPSQKRIALGAPVAMNTARAATSMLTFPSPQLSRELRENHRPPGTDRKIVTMKLGEPPTPVGQHAKPMHAL
eukprot:m.40810 g.40810  ORF g.40810 m.40810 type:complete len:132 (-) comp5633_c0_seq3:56-451(-)